MHKLEELRYIFNFKKTSGPCRVYHQYVVYLYKGLKYP